MGNAMENEREAGRKLVGSLIDRCEKARLKFAPGSSQHSLLQNRLRALRLCRELLEGRQGPPLFTTQELEQALPPVDSILHKCRKAQAKHAPGQPGHARLENIVKAMELSRALILQEMEKTGPRRVAAAGEKTP